MKRIIFIVLLTVLATSFLMAFGSRERPAETISPAPSAKPAGTPTPEESGAIPAEISEALTRAGIQTVRERVPIADFSLPRLGGGTLSLSELRGKVVFLNFWATWCPPCREEMPSMEKLYNTFKAEGFEILAVDLQEDEKTVADFVKKYKLTFPVVLDTSGRTGSTYGVRGIPTTYIVDREGGIIGAVVGGKNWDTPEVFSAFETLVRYGR